MSQPTTKVSSPGRNHASSFVQPDELNSAPRHVTRLITTEFGPDTDSSRGQLPRETRQGTGQGTERAKSEWDGTQDILWLSWLGCGGDIIAGE
ncbi:hypothetical protein Pmani_021561 [Petrolisthes manimaculis]|uniref:Uncharacterized protein n=1 Tax=Petrolisthes manimaculis TaxID=1843537 RepID=A0AAE1U5C2_9EUCA|nr:hypothetical protein Pmani_021561 [Petrolisthes manimaculis]